MLKHQRSFLNLRKTAVALHRLHIRRKSHCINTTVIPAPFCGSPTIVIRSPYSVKVKPIDPVQYGDVKAVIGFLYLETETDEEISERDKTTLQQHIKYDMKSIWSHDREFVEVTTRKAKTQHDFLADFCLIMHANLSIDVHSQSSTICYCTEEQLALQKVIRCYMHANLATTESHSAGSFSYNFGTHHDQSAFWSLSSPFLAIQRAHFVPGQIYSCELAIICI